MSFSLTFLIEDFGINEGSVILTMPRTTGKILTDEKTHSKEFGASSHPHIDTLMGDNLAEFEDDIDLSTTLHQLDRDSEAEETIVVSQFDFFRAGYYHISGKAARLESSSYSSFLSRVASYQCVVFQDKSFLINLYDPTNRVIVTVTGGRDLGHSDESNDFESSGFFRASNAAVLGVAAGTL